MDQPLEILPSSRSAGELDHATPERAGQLPISEVFTSIQGEGRLSGMVSHFIRLSGCNLRCRWCDTPYASWKPEGKQRAIVDVVEEAKRSGASHVVVTGGEPMMFAGLNELTRALNDAGMHITIETAGTVLTPGWFDAGATQGRSTGVCDLYSVSPKLSTSTPVADARDPGGVWAKRHEERRLNIGVLQSILDACVREKLAAYQLKFVVCRETDIDEIRELLSRLGGWSRENVLLMPEGTAAPTPEAKALVVGACMKYGFRYCSRLHIELFGNTRGT